MTLKVVKRDGAVVDFVLENIKNVIKKAGLATEEFGDTKVDYLTAVVFNKIKFNDFGKTEFCVEEIQDMVENTLIEAGLKKTAKAFILYRATRTRAREISKTFDITKIKRYIENNDWRVKENSNMGFSLQGLNNYVSSEITSQYWLNEVYTPEIAKAHNDGVFHIHDLGALSTYCCGWDLEDFLIKGFTGVDGKISSGPPKHFRTALGQLCNLLYSLQGEAAGAQAVSNFDTLLAPFVRHDNMTYLQVYQAMQEFIFNMNVATRVGFQCPFTNITMDIQPPDLFKRKPVIIGGEYQETTYGDYKYEMSLINKAFCEIMVKGDNSGRIFSFPIPTYNITKEFDWEDSTLDDIFLMTGKYGIPYFANYVTSDIDPQDITSMCPLHPETLVEVDMEHSNGDVTREMDTLEQLYIRQTKHNKKLRTIHRTEITPSRLIKFTNYGCIEVILSNGETVIMDVRHVQPVKKTRDDDTIHLKGVDLRVGMYLPFEYSRMLATDYFIKDELIWTKIECIRNVEKEPTEVYCFSVENKTKLFRLLNGLVTHNCRLRIDKTKLSYRGGGLFGAAAKTGSINVITLNLPRLGLEASNEEEFFDMLYKRLHLAKTAHEMKRKMLDELSDAGLYPYSAFYLKEIKEHTGSYWTNHFNTIGIIGMNECLLNFMGTDIGSEEGRKFALKVMDFLREHIIKIQEETNSIYNLEATPAEATAYTLGKKDKDSYGNNINFCNGANVPYYTNSTQLPPDYTTDMFELLDHQDELQCKYTGGTVVHVFLGEEIKDPKITKRLVKKICENYKLPYFSLTPTFSVCNDHGYIAGKKEECPKCGTETEIYSRVVGYYRPIKNFNDAKIDEFKIRKTFV